jgi:hypothetical protein
MSAATSAINVPIVGSCLNIFQPPLPKPRELSYLVHHLHYVMLLDPWSPAPSLLRDGAPMLHPRRREFWRWSATGSASPSHPSLERHNAISMPPIASRCWLRRRSPLPPFKCCRPVDTVGAPSPPPDLPDAYPHEINKTNHNFKFDYFMLPGDEYVSLTLY